MATSTPSTKPATINALREINETALLSAAEEQELAGQIGVRGLAVQVREFVGILLQIVQLPLTELIKVNQLETFGSHTVVPGDHVDTWVFIVVVVETFSPFGSFAFEEGYALCG